MFHQFLDV